MKNIITLFSLFLFAWNIQVTAQVYMSSDIGIGIFKESGSNSLLIQPQTLYFTNLSYRFNELKVSTTFGYNDFFYFENDALIPNSMIHLGLSVGVNLIKNSNNALWI